MRSKSRARGSSRRIIRSRRRLAVLRREIDRAASMDELFDLQRRWGPIDEADPAAEELCYALRAAACYLSGGPPPARERFTLIRPVPADARLTFEVRGRIGERIALVVWADGGLYGSLYALARLEAVAADDSDPAQALDRIVASYEDVLEAPARTALAGADRRVA
jgi:hypothetical protein